MHLILKTVLIDGTPTKVSEEMKHERVLGWLWNVGIGRKALRTDPATAPCWASSLPSAAASCLKRRSG